MSKQSKEHKLYPIAHIPVLDSHEDLHDSLHLEAKIVVPIKEDIISVNQPQNISNGAQGMEILSAIPKYG